MMQGQKIVPELIQHDFTPAAVAREAVSMLTDASRAARIREGLRDVRRKLGEGGASRRAAKAILEVIAESSKLKAESQWKVQTKGGPAGPPFVCTADFVLTFPF